MWWRVMQWANALLALIVEAELAHGRGAGGAKRKAVVEASAEELGAFLTAQQIGGCAPMQIVSYIGQVTDGVVGLLNCVGIFPGAAARSSPAPAPAARSASPAPPPAEG